MTSILSRLSIQVILSLDGLRRRPILRLDMDDQSAFWIYVLIVLNSTPITRFVREEFQGKVICMLVGKVVRVAILVQMADVDLPLIGDEGTIGPFVHKACLLPWTHPDGVIWEFFWAVGHVRLAA